MISSHSHFVFKIHTVNVDIFMCMNFHEFAKIGNFARIYIRAFEIIVYIWHNKGCFHDIHIFADTSETRITRKYVQRENSQ